MRLLLHIWLERRNTNSRCVVAIIWWHLLPISAWNILHFILPRAFFVLVFFSRGNFICWSIAYKDLQYLQFPWNWWIYKTFVLEWIMGMNPFLFAIEKHLERGFKCHCCFAIKWSLCCKLLFTVLWITEHNFKFSIGKPINWLKPIKSSI